MRTKSLLAAAALVAAGVLSSEAQNNVYSLNVVGYVNVQILPGYNLISNPLKDTANPTAAINPALTNAPALADSSSLFGWDEGAQDFTQPSIWVASESVWYDAGGENLSTATVPRGTSFFIKNEGGAATLTLVGEVPQGQDVRAIIPAYSFGADFVPVSQEISTNGFPVADSSTIQTFDPTIGALGDYSQPLIGDSGGWLDGNGDPAVFAPQVAQGWLYSNPGSSANWTRNFTVQP